MTPKRSAYAATVNSGDNAFGHIRLMKGQEKEDKTHFNGVHGANVNSGDCHAREHVTTDLESTHGQGRPQYSDGWGAYPAEIDRRSHDKKAAAGNKTKLDDGEGDWVTKLFEDCFPCVRGQGGRCIP